MFKFVCVQALMRTIYQRAFDQARATFERSLSALKNLQKQIFQSKNFAFLGGFVASR